MSDAKTYSPNWSKLIARAWVDPSFKDQLFSDPQKVLTDYQIDKVGGREVAALSGKIKVVDGPVEGHEKPWDEGDKVMIPFPAAPREYDTVLSPEQIKAAGGESTAKKAINSAYATSSEQKHSASTAGTAADAAASAAALCA
jgi:hypothetical protein